MSNEKKDKKIARNMRKNTIIDCKIANSTIYFQLQRPNKTFYNTKINLKTLNFSEITAFDFDTVSTHTLLNDGDIRKVYKCENRILLHTKIGDVKKYYMITDRIIELLKDEYFERYLNHYLDKNW